MADACKDAVWLGSTLNDISAINDEVKWEQVQKRQILWSPMPNEPEIEEPTVTRLIYTDSNSSISIAKDPKHSERTKHIDYRYHYTREAVETGRVRIEHLPSSQLLADALTKALSKVKHERHVKAMGLRPVEVDV